MPGHADAHLTLPPSASARSLSSSPASSRPSTPVSGGFHEPFGAENGAESGDPGPSPPPYTSEVAAAEDSGVTIVVTSGSPGIDHGPRNARQNPSHFKPSPSTDDVAGLAKLVFPTHEHVGHATIGSSIFNLASSAIGAGALTFPYAFAKLGVVPALIVMAVSCAMCIYTIDVLIRLVDILKAPTYEKLGETLFGAKGRHAVGVTVLTMTVGIAAVYCVLVGQFLSPVLEVLSESTSYPSGPWGTRLAIFCLWLALMLPWCLLKNIDSLKYISAGAVLAILVTVMALIVHGALHVSPSEAGERSRAAAPGSIEIIQAVTNMKVGFTGQIVSFAVYNEMGGATVPRMLKATSIAMATCAVIYFIVGISGVIAVGLDAPENVLEAFADPLGQWYTIIAYMAMLVVIIVSFPIMVFPARDAVLAMIGYETSYASPDHVRLGVSVAIAFCALVIGLFVPGLNLLFGVIGGISGNLISNVLPAVFALKSGEWTVEKVGKVQRVAIFVPLLYGIIVGPLGLAVSIYLTFRPDDDGSASPQPSVNNASAVQAANTTANALTGLASMARLTAP
uniref:Amino acid transporter transmembrane domain-containing protein n=1 Tax=Neobodo designis TaxID=312471 RepID=A0A7S1PUG8_NEODS|mmetsp:Transcript_20669/g.64277  ORF Transcript_20669/g.64277 Transcript_20669/m.64277 type:complete len:565 (+) Transcript_20669:46-1740(+)